MFPEDHMSEQLTKEPSEEGLARECMPPNLQLHTLSAEFNHSLLIPGHTHTHRHTVSYFIPYTELGCGSLLQPIPINSHVPGG